MGWAEFEEKSFEKALYTQLEDGTTFNVWSPGQCFEAYIGIDYAGNIFSNEFWSRFGGNIPKGVVLNDYNMGYIWKKMVKKKMLPNFNLNLFIQAKRPYVHDGDTNALFFKGKHYSFKINQRQQKILEKLHHKIHNKALLVYAAPAFDTNDKLFEYTQRGSIISHTSFPKVIDLSGHSYWFYSDVYEGIACSEPDTIATESISSLMERFVNMSEDMDYSENKEELTYLMARNLKILSNIIIEVLSENSNYDQEFQFYFSQIKEFEGVYNYFDRRRFTESILFEALQDYMRVTLFCESFNLKWFTMI